MAGRLHRALTRARLFAESVLDALRSVYRMPPALPAGRPPAVGAGRLRERTRAVSILLRTVAALGIPWSCRRSAFAVYRALLREGTPVRLCFGMRRARPGEAHRGTYVGHVWTRRDSEGNADSHAGYLEADDFPMTVTYPATRENVGWRRG